MTTYHLRGTDGTEVFTGTIQPPPGGGSQPTDAVVQFTDAAGTASPLLPIVAVDQAGGTFTVAGDQRRYFPFTGADIFVAGSTGNDGVYNPAGGASFDAGSNRTTIGVGSPLPDATADGTLQGAVILTGEVVIPPNGAVEWIEVVTEEAWLDGGSGLNAYWSAGYTGDPYAFTGNAGAGSTGISAVGTWQWPINTLHTSGSMTPNIPDAVLDGYKLFPDGTTVTIVAAVDPGKPVTGNTRFVVHHHFTDPVTPARDPA